MNTDIMWCIIVDEIIDGRILKAKETYDRALLEMCRDDSNAILAKARFILHQMSDNERLDFFNEIESGYCRYCGINNPSCQCWNDVIK